MSSRKKDPRIEDIIDVIFAQKNVIDTLIQQSVQHQQMMTLLMRKGVITEQELKEECQRYEEIANIVREASKHRNQNGQGNDQKKSGGTESDSGHQQLRLL